MFNTHLLLFVYITCYICVFAICHMLIYFATFHTTNSFSCCLCFSNSHTLLLFLSFISIQILFSHPSKLYVRQKQRKKKQNM